jgi:hypothetical protein
MEIILASMPNHCDIFEACADRAMHSIQHIAQPPTPSGTYETRTAHARILITFQIVISR